MAEFKAGDRVVKMSGAAAGKYGTVNSVRDDGTLNVTFDGERLPRYCDPERCGQVATNAKFKVGDKVKVIGADNVIDEMAIGEVAKVTRILRDGLYWISGSGFAGAFKEGVLQAANSRAANAIKIGAYGLPEVQPGQKVRVIARGFSTTGKVLTVEKVGNGFGGNIVAGGFAYKPQDLEIVNSRAANARILDRDGRAVRVGDRVRLAGTSSPGLGKVGVIVKTDDDWGDVTVKTEDGKTYEYEASAVVKIANAARNAVARNAGRFELVEHNMGRSFGVYDSATSGYIADDIPLRDALRILKTKGETAEQAKKDLDWTDPAAIDRLW